MKLALILAMSLTMSSFAFANGSKTELILKNLVKASAKMVKNDVRTVVREVENTDGNPCMPDGKSFQIDLQVKMARGFNIQKTRIIYVWETVKTIGVDNDGRVMELCAE